MLRGFVETTSGLVQLFRRSRLALVVARLYHGASAAFLPRPVITAIVDCCSAAAFSSIIRWYSEGVQVPWAIIEVLRATAAIHHLERVAE